MRFRLHPRAVTLLATLLAAASAGAVTPAEGELTDARRWVAARFEGVQPGPATEPGLLVLANHDPIHRNTRGGHRLRIGGKEYPRGLYCHANSKLLVRLPGPGKQFTAVVGIDSNADTSPGRGSVIFSVRVKERVAFRSAVLREGMPGVPVQVDLAGAREFYLEIGDAGDGIGWDQSDWADARVVLADGKEV